ncbi:MAG: UbiA family prenyltransferase [Phycisphaerae bacterium]|jgi:4-hydroxybenzoate polyprenyltransferase|nr:UbiA family prenyltransferase [Phycisphaerae bacterium]
MTTEKRSQLGAWLQLLRIPNLLTVPADPIVGFFSWGCYSSIEKGFVDTGGILVVVPCVVAAVLLYCAGLILNDLFDLKEDRRDRPNRPLPSGQISTTTATITAIILLIGGVAAAAFNGALCAGIAAALAVAVVSYNAGVKRIPIAGALNMGLCRGLSIFLGLAISSSLNLGQDSAGGLLAWEKLSMLLSWPFYPITPMILYIASVTLIAARETKTSRMRIRPWLPGAITAVWMSCVMYPWPQWDNVLSCLSFIVIAGLPVAVALVCGWRLTGKSEPRIVQTVVGELVGNLLLIQAAVVYFNSYSTGAHNEGIPLAIALGLAYLAFIPLSRRFYAS